MAAAVPFGLIEHFGKDEGRFDRVEDLAAVKKIIIRVRPAAVYVGNRFTGSDLRHDPGGDLISGPVDRDDLDLRVVLFEFVEQRRLSVAADVKIQPPFFLGRCNGLFPIALPVGAKP